MSGALRCPPAAAPRPGGALRCPPAAAPRPGGAPSAKGFLSDESLIPSLPMPDDLEASFTESSARLATSGIKMTTLPSTPLSPAEASESVEAGAAMVSPASARAFVSAAA